MRYYTLLVPWSDRPTVWHPTEKTGPFAVLSRGAFKSRSDAHEWAREHLGHDPKYSIKPCWNGLPRMYVAKPCFRIAARKLTPAFAWPGGYTITYFDMSTGDALCADCAGIERFKTKLTPDVIWEGPSDFCAECNTEIASEYGDPDADDDSDPDADDDSDAEFES